MPALLAFRRHHSALSGRLRPNFKRHDAGAPSLWTRLPKRARELDFPRAGGRACDPDAKTRRNDRPTPKSRPERGRQQSRSRPVEPLPIRSAHHRQKMPPGGADIAVLRAWRRIPIEVNPHTNGCHAVRSVSDENLSACPCWIRFKALLQRLMCHKRNTAAEHRRHCRIWQPRSPPREDEPERCRFDL